MPDELPESDGSSLAAMAGTLADGRPVTELRRDLALLELVDLALARGMTWAQIGVAVWGASGREAKRKVRHLRERAGRAQRLKENQAG